MAFPHLLAIGRRITAGRVAQDRIGYPCSTRRPGDRWAMPVAANDEEVRGRALSWIPSEEMLMARLVGDGARKGTTVVGRFGDVTKRPVVWAGIALALAVSGRRGRNAAVRGGVGYVAGSLVQLPVGMVVNRSRPEGASRLTLVGPLTSSFPSGHCASELGFSLGAAQEIPWLFVPLYTATLAAEWALVRCRAHYPSDIFGGAAISIVVACAMSKAWPPRRTRSEEQAAATKAT